MNVTAFLPTRTWRLHSVIDRNHRRCLAWLTLLLLIGIPARTVRAQAPAEQAFRHQAGNGTASSLTVAPAPTVTAVFDDVTLDVALAEISRQTGIPVMYGEDVFRSSGRVSARFKNARFSEALGEVLRQTAFRAVPVQGGSGVIVERAPVAPPDSGTIVGRVVHGSAASAVPLASAEVVLLNPHRVAVTNQNGEFIFLNVPSGPRELTVRLLGYHPASEKVQVTAGRSVRVEIRLEESAISLDEIVVTGRAMGTARREIGTTIATISARDLELAPAVDLSQVLQSRVTGMTVMSSAGNAGQGSTIIMRGPVSLTQGVEPIIYLDGVRIDNSKEAYITSEGAWTGLDDIDPADIERIEVVKGAAAATLYGTEAAAGVIQIFTKKGKGGSLRWNYNAMAGINHTPFEYWDLSVYSPWFYDNFVRTGSTYSHNLALSGTDGAFSYRIAGNLSGNEGVLVLSSSESRTFRANMTFAPSDKVRLDVNNGYYTRRVSFPEEGSNNYSFALNGLTAGERGLFYPTLELKEGTEKVAKFGRYTASAQVAYTPSPRWSHQLILGTEVLNEDTWRRREYESIYASGGLLYNLRRNATTLNLDYTARMQLQVSPRVRLGTAVGFQAYSKKQALLRAQASAFPAPGIETIGGGSVRSGLERRIASKSAGYFGEQQVALDEKVFVTLGLRADGHSAFGESLGYQFYPKVDLSYLLSAEDFWPERYGSLRLRAAYGTAGRQPTAYATEQTWQSIRAAGGEPGFIPENLGNPDLRPEVSHEIEAGFDFTSAGDGRLAVEYTYYNQRTVDALYQRQPPPSEGFLETQLVNIGEVRNRGHELSVVGKLITGSRYAWTTRVAVSTNRNKVTSLGGVPPANVGSQHFNQWIREGYPAGALFGDRYEKRGDQLVLVTDAYLGPPLPTRTLSLSSDVVLFRNVSLNALVDYKGGHKIFSNTMRWLMNATISQGEPFYDPDDPETAEFTPGLPVAWMCRGAVDELTQKRCDEEWSVHRGDYVYPADSWHLREVAVSYRVPAAFVARFGARSATIVLAGRNLWRHQKYPGLDAESNYITANPLASQSYFDTPTPRQYTVRLNLVF